MEANKKKKNAKAIVIIAIAILICFSAIAVRHYSSSLLFTGNWAMHSAEAQIKERISSEINRLSISNEEKQKLVSEKLSQELKRYMPLIEKRSESYKQYFKDKDNQTYLYGIDSYFYYKKIKEKSTDNFVAVFGYYWNWLLNFFSKTSFMRSSFMLPYVFMSLASLAFFAFCYFVLKKEHKNALFYSAAASLLFAVHPELLQFTMAGIADTNSFNIFFFILSFFLAFLVAEAKGTKKKAFSVFALAIAIALFRYTWTGWSMCLFLLAASFAAYFAFKIPELISFESWPLKIIKERIKAKRLKPKLQLALFFGFILAIFMMPVALKLISGYLPYTAQIYLKLRESGGSLPSSYNFIIELRSLSLEEIAFKTGSLYFAALAAFGFVLMLAKAVFRKKASYSFIIVPLALMAFASTRSVRFFPYSIAFSIIAMFYAIAWLASRLRNYPKAVAEKTWQKIMLKLKSMKKADKGTYKSHEKEKKEKKAKAKVSLYEAIAAISIIFLVVAFSYGSLAKNYEKVISIRPVVDDAIYNTAIKLKDSSAQNAMVISWWDRGHIYSALADRKVLLSGSPGMPTTYWLAKALTEKDEKKAANILRGLVCGGIEKAYDNVIGRLGLAKGSLAFDELLAKDKNNSISYLTGLGISKKDAIKIRRQLYCNARESYLVLDDSLLLLMPNIMYYANWNPGFRVIKNLEGTKEDKIEAISKRLGFSKKDSEMLYESYKSYSRNKFRPIIQYPCKKEKDRFVCSINGKKAGFDMKTGKSNIKLSKAYIVETNIISYKLNKTSSYPVLIIYNRDGNYHAVVLDKGYEETALIRLLLLKGSGMKSFKPVIRQAWPVTKLVVAYKLNFS